MNKKKKIKYKHLTFFILANTINKLKFMILKKNLIDKIY